jgi:hypothetical protein
MNQSSQYINAAPRVKQGERKVAHYQEINDRRLESKGFFRVDSIPIL